METGKKLMTIDQFLMYETSGSSSSISPLELYYEAGTEPNSFIASNSYGEDAYYDFLTGCGNSPQYYGDGFQVTDNSLIAKTSGTMFIYAEYGNRGSGYDIMYDYYINDIKVGNSIAIGRYDSKNILTAITIENGETFRIIYSGQTRYRNCEKLFIRGG